MTNIRKGFSKLIAVFSAFTIICFIMNYSVNWTSKATDYSQQEVKEKVNEMAVLINEARVENGLDPLYIVPYLCDISAVRAREIIFDFSHSRNGEMFSTIIDENLVSYYSAAENIAAGREEAELTFNQWKNSTNHWNAILNPNYTHMGVGFAYEPNSTYHWYWETMFIQSDMNFDGQKLPTRYEIVPKSSGDLNGDAVVDSFDYLVLTEYLQKTKANKPVYFNELQIESADLLKDGYITDADAMVLQRYILGEYTKLPYDLFG